MRIAQDVRGEGRQGDAVRGQGVQDTEYVGEPLPESLDVTARNARGTDLCRPGCQAELRRLGEQPRPQLLPPGTLGGAHRRTVGQRPPEVLDETPQPSA